MAMGTFPEIGPTGTMSSTSAPSIESGSDGPTMLVTKTLIAAAARCTNVPRTSREGPHRAEEPHRRRVEPALCNRVNPAICLMRDVSVPGPIRSGTLHPCHPVAQLVRRAALS